MASVLVIGGGISGLSSAIRLAECGHDVEVLAREFTPQTTSDIAAAMWGPYACEPADRVMRWSMESFEEFERLSKDPSTGVLMRDGVCGFSTPALPKWAASVPTSRVASPVELPAGCQSATIARMPLIDMSRYMPYLHSLAQRSGIRMKQGVVSSIREVQDQGDVVVNATGLGARDVAADTNMHSVRGRVLILEQFGLDEYTWITNDRWPIGVFPRTNDIILNGTYEVDVESFDVPEGTDDLIFERCLAVEPRLQGAKRIGARIGFRPVRDQVRVELEVQGETPVVHNYGHGGGGVTMSWGCAREVAELVTEVTKSS